MNRQAFTLIELLVVIAIIALLAAILFPVFARAKQSAYRAQALSNARQLGASNHLYMADYDDVFSPYFSGFDTATKTYNAPQMYWPQLVSAYIQPVKGRGEHGQALADDLPKIFFDPVKPFKSQLDIGFPYGIVSSWGVSDDIVDWFGPKGIDPSKKPASASQVANPASCLHLVETWDWLLRDGFPGNAISQSFFGEDGMGARMSVDAPHSARYPKADLNSPADPNGLNIVVFCDGHVAAQRVGHLTESGELWSRGGNAAWP